MRTRAERRVAARYRWDRLQVSFWFAPAVMGLGAVLLAWAMDGLAQFMRQGKRVFAYKIGERAMSADIINHSAR
jgi:hypothetical protein